ncbi:CgeB family protein [Hymenobacter actinosclerus]|uniref:Spore maturation protein CgeB n=1 Tax=Hymenobacter actinosclerus TaxID=82805 RepID=A0A1I0AYQ5_9BACT|nr:glycosyltransferase [Hymenobacter actinosclerus]SES99511.1 spore maturation protein CgeB [Hymenobacter actinosclerus]
MKFLLSIPAYTRTNPMTHFAATALRLMGHEVVAFNYERENQLERMREKLGKAKFHAYKNRQLLELADEVKPDVFFTVYGRYHDAATLRELKRRGLPTICWWLDDPISLAHKYIPLEEYDFFFSNSHGTQAVYRHYHAREPHYLPVAVDPAIHRPLEGVEQQYDIVFAGDWHPVRERVLLELARHHRLTIIGPWQRNLAKNSPLREHFLRFGYFTPAEMALLFNQARIVLNVHQWYQRWPYGINPRLFEASGCRAFQLSDNKTEIADLYVPSEEIGLYEDAAELPELCAHYLANPAERNRIAANAYARTMRDHTYVHRMTHMLQVCGLS